jgi:hypothetical protein
MHPSSGRTALAAVLSTALIAAPSALGQTSARDGYTEPAGSVQQQLGRGHDPVSSKAARRTDSSRLPFTGLDIALVLGASGVLLALGASIRRLSRRGATP